MPKLSITQLFDLSGLRAIVTGAAQGLGQAIAFRLAEAGASVLLAGHNENGLRDSAGAITKAGGKACFVLADTGQLADVDRIVKTALDQLGGVDILVNCAGGMHPFTPATDITEETYNKTLDRNLKGTFFLSQRVIRHMIQRGGGGKIINIASIAAIRPDPQLAAYNASKAAIVSLTESLATEFASRRILVNTIAPGPILTPNTAPAYEIPAIQEIVKQRIPLGQIGEPEDIANAALFLASRAANYMTGSLMVVDGGMTAT